MTVFSEEGVKSSKAGASSPVTVTLVREEAAGRVSDLGEKGASVTQRNGIKESKEMGRHQPRGGGGRGAGAVSQNQLEREGFFILQIRPGGRSNPRKRSHSIILERGPRPSL